MISIIVPVYNAEKFIKETVKSVLNQTYTDFELLLVDDCSKDGSVQAIESFEDPRVILLKQEQNAGAYAARNRGLKEAKGRYIAFIDSDDLWEPCKLERELAFMEREDAGFVFTGYEFADENCVGTGKVVKVPHTITFKQALSNTTIFTSTVLIDREKIPDELIEMPHIASEDTATWWRILKAGHIGYGLNENLVKYRRSKGSLSSDKIEALRRIWGLYRKIAGLSVVSSAWYFVGWAFRAVLRRV
ncbi:MAG: glycosyltransferase family 2 protein [Lachnospiraceae bacterium]|nr:glycosyltransferase family 2 protein [Lachnospiraceae bacterium]